jgi:hypothetical protein
MWKWENDAVGNAMDNLQARMRCRVREFGLRRWDDAQK